MLCVLTLQCRERLRDARTILPFSRSQRKFRLKPSVGDYMKSQRLLGLPGITAVCLLLIFVSLTPSPLAARDSRSSIKDFQHVFLIMMENTGFDTLIGNPNTP